MSLRKWAALGLLAAAVVATGSAVWIAHSGNSGPPAPSKRVALARLPRFDDAVVLPSDATAHDAMNLQTELDRSTAVRGYAPISTLTAEFMLQFHPVKATASIRDRMCAKPMTRTYAVALTRTVPNARKELTRAIHEEADVLDIGEDDPDVEVFVDPKASAAAIASLRGQIEHDRDIVNVTVMDEKARGQEYRQLFQGAPDLRADASPESLPLSFRLQVRDGVPLAAVQGRYQHVAAVSSVTPRSNSLWSHAEPVAPHPGVELFMQVKETKLQIDIVEQRLTQDPRVKSYRFFDHNDAYREFKKLFADQPSIVENETPAGLPTSFRVTLRGIRDVASVARDYRAVPGVKIVSTGGQTCTSKP